ncbi:hypothetical protein B566_EDAN007296 [Ephemera danica]|nr:hypothetical protein B566_EDAN007296 [Ephemera danica]
MTVMSPVYGNMTNLCLLCANAQNPEGQAFMDIHGQLGTQLKILDKIHKFFTITIEDGFPLQVCPDCVDKLNICHELAQSSEKAHEKFKTLREEWEANLLLALLVKIKFVLSSEKTARLKFRCRVFCLAHL